MCGIGYLQAGRDDRFRGSKCMVLVYLQARSASAVRAWQAGARPPAVGYPVTLTLRDRYAYADGELPVAGADFVLLCRLTAGCVTRRRASFCGRCCYPADMLRST